MLLEPASEEGRTAIKLITMARAVRTLLVDLLGLVIAPQGVQSGTLPRVPLGPRRVELDALLRIAERVLRVLLGQVGSGTVAEVHVLAGVRLNGLSGHIENGAYSAPGP